MDRAVIGILVLAAVVFVIIFLRAGLEGGWNKLANKASGNAEDRRRRALLGDSSSTANSKPTQTSDAERRESGE